MLNLRRKQVTTASLAALWHNLYVEIGDIESEREWPCGAPWRCRVRSAVLASLDRFDDAEVMLERAVATRAKACS